MKRLPILALLFITSYAHADPPKFTSLGRFGYGEASASDVSADGKVIVGTVYDPAIRDFLAFRWTASGTEFVPFDKQQGISRPRISDDGRVVVGSRPTASGNEAYRWLADGTIEPLGQFPGSIQTNQQAFGVSADGSVIVGTNWQHDTVRPVRWTNTAGPIVIEDRTGYGLSVSSDGSVLAGSVGNDVGPGILWPSGETFGLTNAISNLPQGMNADGSLIAGLSRFRAGLSAVWDEAFVWTAATGTTRIAGQDTAAWDVSPDGGVVVGGSYIAHDQGAFIWTPSGGYKNIQAWLTEIGVSGLEDWHLTHARGVSFNGRTIVGEGIHAGQTEAWMLEIPVEWNLEEIPEPATWILAAIAVGLLALWKA